MITTSPNVQGRLGYIAAGMGFVPAPSKCGGAGRACRPSCASPRVRPRSVIRGGCGCGSLSGLKGMGQDLTDYALDYVDYNYDPNAAMLASYDAGSVKPTGGATYNYQTAYQQQLNKIMAGYNTNSAGGQIPPIVPNVNNQAAADKLKSDSSWPILALMGVGIVALMAG